MLCLWEYFPLTVCICAGIDSEACFLSCALRSLTCSLFWQQKKGLTVAHTAGGLSGGCLWKTHDQRHTSVWTRTQKHTRILATPSLALLWWCEGGVAAWGAPLESGTDGQRETTHLSWLTTFLLSFFLFWLPFPPTKFLLSLIYEFLCVHY